MKFFPKPSHRDWKGFYLFQFLQNKPHFCKQLFGCSKTNSGPLSRGEPHQILITGFERLRPEGHRESRNEVGSLDPAERLAGFKPVPNPGRAPSGI